MEIRRIISLGEKRLRKGMWEREPAGNSKLIKEGQGDLREGSEHLKSEDGKIRTRLPYREQGMRWWEAGRDHTRKDWREAAGVRQRWAWAEKGAVLGRVSAVLQSQNEKIALWLTDFFQNISWVTPLLRVWWSVLSDHSALKKQSLES